MRIQITNFTPSESSAGLVEWKEAWGVPQVNDIMYFPGGREHGVVRHVRRTLRAGGDPLLEVTTAHPARCPGCKS